MGLEQFATARAEVALQDPEGQQLALGLPGPARTLVIAADQQSTGTTGIAFLQSLEAQLVVDLVMDPPHRFWNSEKLGLLQGNGWEPVLLTTIPYSINEGPWHGGGWLAQLNNAKDEYLALVDPACCPLFQHLLPLIAADLGKPNEVNDEAFVDSVVSMLREAKQLRTKGPVLALCRWYSWCDAREHWRPWYHFRLLIALLWAMGAGLLSKKSEEISLSLAQLPSAAAEGRKETMREQQGKQEKLRNKGRNMLHTSLLIMMNPLVQRRANIVFELLKATRIFHGQQIKACHNPTGNLEWSSEMAAGEFMVPLLDSRSFLTDPTRLASCGFIISSSVATSLGYSSSEADLWASEEQE
eukprot:10613885-Lingulodinium_polyedra.AAC.1